MLQKININEIFSNPNNPRIIKDFKFKKLVKSIKEFPEMLKLRPIVVNKEGSIIGGNMRYKACKEVGLKEVYIIKAENLSDKQIEELNYTEEKYNYVKENLKKIDIDIEKALLKLLDYEKI